MTRDLCGDPGPVVQQQRASTFLNIGRLDVAVLGEGVEGEGERDYLSSVGIDMMQGFLFARPAFKAIGTIDPGAWGHRVK